MNRRHVVFCTAFASLFFAGRELASLSNIELQPAHSEATSTPSEKGSLRIQPAFKEGNDGPALVSASIGGQEEISSTRSQSQVAVRDGWSIGPTFHFDDPDCATTTLVGGMHSQQLQAGHEAWPVTIAVLAARVANWDGRNVR